MEKEYKDYKLERKINPILRKCCIGFVVFFGFMWTSSIWMPNSKEEFQVTEFNVSMVNSTAKRELTLIRWDYSEEDQLMEVQFQIENNSYDGKDKYAWTARERHKGALKVDAVYEDTEIIVVQIKNIPSKWSVISLRMALEGSNPDNESLYKIYGDTGSIQMVEHIEKKEKNDYYMLDINNTVALYESKIKDLEEQIESARSNIKEVSKSIEDKLAKLEYMTEQETETAMLEINSLQSMVDDYYKDISKYNEEINEYNQRILKAQEKIKAYQ